MKAEIPKETIVRIGRYLDESMTAKEQEEFKNDLLKDRAFQDAYLDQIGMDKAMESLIFEDSSRIRKAVIAELKSNTTKETKAIVIKRLKKRRLKVKARKQGQWKQRSALLLTLAAIMMIVAKLFILDTPKGLIGTLHIDSKNTQVTCNNIALESGAIIYDGDVLKLGESGSARLEYGSDLTVLTLQKNSKVEFQKHGKSIKLDFGEISCDVDKQSQGDVFSIHTSSSITTVVGTIFDLSSTGKESIVEMKEGTVRFQRKSDMRTIEISTGMGASSEDMRPYTVDIKGNNSKGLVGHWMLDGDKKDIAVDSSINANHGTVLNPSWAKNGKIGGALIGDGASTYIDIPTKGLPYGSQAFTVSVWAKTEFVNPKNYMHIFSYGNHLQNKSIYIGRSQNDLIIGTPGDSAGRVRNFWNGDNVWHHIVLTYDGSIMKYYVDGAFVGKAERRWNIVPEKLRIGQQVNDDEFWAGTIDDVRIYNKALSLKEINSLATQK